MITSFPPPEEKKQKSQAKQLNQPSQRCWKKYIGNFYNK